MSERRASQRVGGSVTSIDVAAHAGLSQTTVARAFSNPDKVAPATRAKVEAAAAELGYVPNAIARSLKSQRTHIIAAVVPSIGEYWQSVITAFSRLLADRDRQLLLFSFSDPGQLEDVLGSLAQYRVDGVILASANIDAGRLARMQSQRLPLVAFNQPAASGVIPSVSVDNAEGMGRLAAHLVDAGVEWVAYIGGIATTSTDQTRYRGASTTLAAAGVACPYTEAGGWAYEHGYAAARALVEADDLPDAVMVAGDELAFGVIDALEDRGVAVPDQVLVTGFDGLPQASWAGYDLTTLTQPVELLVEQAIELLLADADPDDAPDVVVSGEMRIGRTTKSVSTSERRSEPTPDPSENHG
ncbi:MAG: LacI family DNA-binding transcriptional regulator [Actinomycetota bacterium]